MQALELGPAFLPEEIDGRWHGLIDANIVAHHKEIRNIDWQAETRSTKVTIWATTPLIDELDQIAYEHGSHLLLGGCASSTDGYAHS